MKTQRAHPSNSGFTLIELLVAMVITALIVTVLVSITSIAMDTWNRSRAELRASRQGKAMVDSLARDFESLVTRRGNEFEWLSAIRSLPEGSALQSTNAAELVFFSASTDRYNGEIGGPKDEGGDVSCVAYLLDYKDPIEDGGKEFRTFVLNRLLVDPKPTFEKLLGQKTLNGLIKEEDIAELQNFVCENVYQFTVVFHVEISDPLTGAPLTVQLMVGQHSLTEFRFKGTGIAWQGTLPDRPSNIPDDPAFENLLKAGRLVGVEISLTVLSDAAINRIRRGAVPSGDDAALVKFLSSNSHNYSKFIRLSSL